MLNADEVVQRSEIIRHEQGQPFAINFKPMYSLERIRRRALCEAVLEGISDADLLTLRDTLAHLRKGAAHGSTRDMGPV